MQLDTDLIKDSHTDMDMDTDTATECDLTDQEQERPTTREPRSAISDGCTLADALRRAGMYDQTPTSSFIEGGGGEEAKGTGNTS